MPVTGIFFEGLFSMKKNTGG